MEGAVLNGPGNVNAALTADIFVEAACQQDAGFELICSGCADQYT